MSKLKEIIKKEAVLIIAWFFAAVSMLFVPPDSSYIGYISFDVLSVLFCLMAVVAGLTRCGLFELLSQKLLVRCASTRLISLILTMLCFFSSMLITNDVALIAFVPLTLMLFKGLSQKRLIYTVVLETVAANLGSMLTPIGNPQNLYLYSHYGMDIWEFTRTVLPFFILSLVIIFFAAVLPGGGSFTLKSLVKSSPLHKPGLIFYALLFALSLLTVLHVLDYRICLGVTAVSILIFNRRVLLRVDYSLLLTFVAFFIFVGNLARIDAVKSTLSALMHGRELLLSVITSQIISNVPAAIMLSGFTENATALLVGVNIGGLGTIIASLASLISYRLYAKSVEAKPGLFLGVFSAVNFVMLFILTAFALIL